MEGNMIQTFEAEQQPMYTLTFKHTMCQCCYVCLTGVCWGGNSSDLRVVAADQKGQNCKLKKHKDLDTETNIHISNNR